MLKPTQLREYMKNELSFLKSTQLKCAFLYLVSVAPSKVKLEELHEIIVPDKCKLFIYELNKLKILWDLIHEDIQESDQAPTPEFTRNTELVFLNMLVNGNLGEYYYQKLSQHSKNVDNYYFLNNTYTPGCYQVFSQKDLVLSLRVFDVIFQVVLEAIDNPIYQKTDFIIWINLDSSQLTKGLVSDMMDQWEKWDYLHSRYCFDRKKNNHYKIPGIAFQFSDSELRQFCVKNFLIDQNTLTRLAKSPEYLEVIIDKLRYHLAQKGLTDFSLEFKPTKK